MTQMVMITADLKFFFRTAILSISDHPLDPGRLRFIHRILP